MSDVAYNAGLEIRYAIAASGVDPIQHIPEVGAIIERRLAEARKAAFIEAAEIAVAFAGKHNPSYGLVNREIHEALLAVVTALRAKAEETRT